MLNQSPYVLVASMMPQDATTALFFTNLADRAPVRIVSSRIGSARRPLRAVHAINDLAQAMAGASAVVLVRGLLEAESLASCAAWLNLPRYYFADDNFMVLRTEPGLADARWFQDYTVERVRHALQGFAGVLLATPSLVDYFRDQRLHENAMLYPPVAGPRLAASRASAGTLTIGFFGGLHRRETFLTHVYPALRRLAGEHQVRVISAGIDARDLPSDSRLPIVSLPYNPSYSDALATMAGYGIDVLVHPGTATSHHAYKNTHVIINAHALGAVPVFSANPPYDALKDDGVALLSENTEDAWYSTLTRVVESPGLRRDLQERLAAYCSTHFGGSPNLQVVSTILRNHPAPTSRVRARRLVLGMPFRGLSLGRQSIARVFARLA